MSPDTVDAGCPPAEDRRADFRVLIVEDEFLVASEIEQALIAGGLKVVGVAATAEEAIGLAKLNRPCLAIMDIRLAGKRDGIDAALQLLREHGLRCIFATAHVDDEVRRRAAPAMPLAWVQKPYSTSSLLDLVRQIRDATSGELKIREER
jgi:two-component system, response regulator PdtaR